MGLEDVYDFLDDNIKKYIDDFFDQIPQKMYTVKQFEKIADAYDTTQIIKDYESYLKKNKCEDPVANYDEILVIGSRFYTSCMNRFNGEADEWDS